MSLKSHRQEVIYEMATRYDRYPTIVVDNHEDGYDIYGIADNRRQRHVYWVFEDREGSGVYTHFVMEWDGGWEIIHVDEFPSVDP